MKIRLIGVLFLSACVSSPALGNVDRGLAAYKQGDFVAAFTEFRAAAEQGVAHAQFNLGQMYRVGQGVPQSYLEAVRWYRLAADQGIPSAQFNLGQMYFLGQGVGQNPDQAMHWYRLSAEQGYPSAQLNLGLMHARGDGIPKDLIQAYKWFSLNAAHGDEQARQALRITEEQMTQDQIAEAQRLAAEVWERIQGKN